MLFSCLLGNQEPSDEFSLQDKARNATTKILADIEGHLARLSWGIVS
jgi:hypothetical protein